MKGFYIVLILLLFRLACFAQLDSVFDQSVYRTFIVHLPVGYTPNAQYPLVMSLHGLGSNAAQEELYSQFDNVADTAQFIVVYPNAISGEWSITSNTDVNFISNLIDTIRNRYSCNSCLFFNGISDGGFMTYKLACSLLKPITAIAVVSGNMTQFLENTCVIANGLPVMHFHGTADAIVSYNGTYGIPPVDTTILWWVNKNNCNSNPVYTLLPNISTNDSCTAENYTYSGGIGGSEVTFYKIINGGHTWPGAIPVPGLGNTNEDFNASALMGSFFKKHCSAATEINKIAPGVKASVFPNPATGSFVIDVPDQSFDWNMYDLNGQRIAFGKNIYSKVQFNCSGLRSGIYFIRVIGLDFLFDQKMVME